MKDEYPRWFYGPNNEAKVCDAADDVPEGWVDHPSKLAPPEEGEKPLDL